MILESILRMQVVEDDSIILDSVSLWGVTRLERS